MISICKTCFGSGLVGRKHCSACHGFGAGAELAGRFLYWGKRLDSFEIRLDKVRRAGRLITNLIVALVIILTFLYFGLHAVLDQSIDEVVTLDFWTTPHPALLFFWVGWLFVLYAISRGIRSTERIKPVLKRKYAREGEVQELAPASFADILKQKHRNRVDISLAFQPGAMSAISKAYKLAAAQRHAALSPVHIVSNLLSDKMILVLLGRMGLAVGKVQAPLLRLLEKQPAANQAPQVSEPAFNAFFEAYFDAYLNRRPFVTSIALFAAAVRNDEQIKEIFYSLEVEEEKLMNVVAWLRIGEALTEQYAKFRGAARLKPKGAMNRAMTAQATKELDKVSQDLTQVGRLGYLPPLINREKEMAEIFRIFEGGSRSVVLVGKPGVGKDAIVAGIAERMIEEEVPTVLSDKRIVQLSVPQLVSGVDPAKAGERLLIVLGEVARSGNILLVVPDVHQLVGVAIGEGIDLADTFATELGKGYFLCIATSGEAEYKKFLEGHSLGRALEKVGVEEMDQNTAIQTLEAKSGSIEAKQRVFFSYDAIERAVELSAKYMHDRFLPAKAIEVAKEAAEMVRQKRGAKQLISGEDVAGIVAEKTKIPVTQVTTEESEKLLHLEEEMHKRIIDQEEAVKVVAAALRRARAELRSEKRPIANFLFLGPTGVGKTELAKTVAATYFGNETAMIRIDMSEYQNQPSLARLIGAPGAKEGGILTEAVRKQPFTIVLLDELEKAHKDILNVFLQVMDDGRLTDNHGRTIDFTNAILIATSNAGAQLIQDEVRAGTAIEKIKDRLINEKLREFFRPEFLNRFDGVIVFKPLSSDDILQITWLMIGQIQKKLEQKGINLEVEDVAAEELARAGFDPVFGARPLRRVIQEKVENALANFLLKQKLGRRDTVIFKPGGQIEVRKAEVL